DAGVLGLVELHAAGPELQKVLSDFDSKAWKAAATPSRDHHGRNAGGAALGVRRHIKYRSLCRLAARADQTLGQLRRRKPAPAFEAGPVDCHDFQALTTHMQGGPPTIVVLCLYDGLGATGVNIRKLQPVGVLVRGLQGDWMVIGDFNMPPEQLQQSAWPAEVQGEIAAPTDVAFSQHTGGRMLDCSAVGGIGVHRPCQLLAHVGGEFRSHVGLIAGVELGASGR
ncbi:unnamed protein product, partial [Prorocentrum cordatum]